MKPLYTAVPAFVWSLVFAALLGAPGSGFAQGGTASGSLSGVVVDESGGVVPGVTVTVTNQLTNQPRSVVTTSAGLYRFAGLAPSVYSVTGELAGFATVKLTDITLNVGSALDVNLTMTVSKLSENVTVRAEGLIVESAKTDLSTTITQQQIESLPTSSRNFLDFALLTPAAVENFTTTQQGIGLNIGGARAKEGALLVDGFWNTDESFTFPRLQYSTDAVQEFQVVSLGATAEFGRAIGGIVNAVTKSGGNRVSGSGYGFFRDKSLNSQGVLEKQRGTRKADFSRKLWGGSLGGPIVQDRTFFFGAAERKNQRTPADNNIQPQNAVAIGLPAEDVGSLPGYILTTFAMGKVTHNLTRNHSLQAAFVFTKDTQHNMIFQSFTSRSRGLRIRPTDWSAQVGWQGITRAGTWLHDLRASYFPRDYTLDSPDEGGAPLTAAGQLRSSNAPSVNITGVASFGGGRISNQQQTDPVQVIYSSTISKNRHNIKFGTDVMSVGFDYFRYGGPSSGTYTFRNVADFQAGRYSTYTQMFGDPFISRHHTYLSGYVQDSWAMSNRLTLNYGLRYDVEWLSKYNGASFGDDFNNIGPRLAMSYDLTGKGRTLIKGSAGIFYDRIFQNPITPTFYGFKDVLQQVSATWLFGQPGAPVYPATFATETLPATAPANVRNVNIMPDDLQVPASNQFVLSIDHAFRPNLAATVSFLHNRSRNKEIPFDRNLRYDEATARWVRPDPAFRQIQQYTFTGDAEFTGLVLEVKQRLANGLTYGGNLTLSRAYDMNNNFNVGPNDQRFPDAEWGPSGDVPKVRGVVHASYDLGRFMSFSAIYRGRTGYNFDPRAGATFDLNGDGAFNDRTPTFERNSFRGPTTHTVDSRITWNVPWRSRRLQVMIEGFNLFDRGNVREVFTTYGPNPAVPDPLFGTPLNYFPPREIQLGVRMTF